MSLFAALLLAAGLTTVAPTVSAISPSIGFYDGGDTVTITVSSSAGATGAAVAGTALTAFAIVDATHVSGKTGTMTRGTNQAVTVTNAAGTGSANLWETFDPTSPPGASATCVTYYSARHCTNTGNGTIVTAIPDTKGSNPGVIPAGNEPTFVAANASYNNRPTFHFAGGTSQRFATTNAGGITTGARTWVSISNTANAGNGYLFSIAGGATDAYYWSSAGGSLNATTDGGVTNNSIATSGVNVDVAVNLGTASSRHYVNAQTANTASSGTLAATGGAAYTVGNYQAPSTSFVLTGDLAEFCIYSGALSDADAKYLQVGYGKIYNITIGP